MMGDRNRDDALNLLGLDGPADHATVARAFRAAAKSARPDQDGGDPERFRQVIEAYRLLQARTLALPAPTPCPSQPPEPRPVLVLTPMQAISGGSMEVMLEGRCLLVHAPPGLRTGDHVRLRRKGVSTLLPVLIRPADGLSVLGADLFMRWPVAARLMRDGGRIEIETHAGPRSAWLVPDMVEPVRLRLKGLGLPGRGARTAGHLFVTLEASSDLPSAAEDLLLRFSRVWTPERLAA